MEDKNKIKKRFNKRLVFEISEIKHKEIKLAATELGLSMKAFIDECIKEKIQKEKDDKNY